MKTSSSRALANYLDYINSVIRIIENNAAVDVSCMDQVIPYVLYPRQDELFLKVRQHESLVRTTLMGASSDVLRFHRCFFASYEKGTTYRYVMGMSSLKYYREIMSGALGISLAKKCISESLSYQREKNIKINIVQQAPDFCMFLGSKECLFAVIDARTPGTVTGDPVPRDTFLRKFEQEFNRGKPIESWSNSLLANPLNELVAPSQDGKWRDFSQPSANGAIQIIPGAFIYKGKNYLLSGKALQVLEVMSKRRHQRITIRELREEVWEESGVSGPDEDDLVSDETIRCTISTARRALRKAQREAGVKIKDPIRAVDRGGDRTAWELVLDEK